jgi:flagellar biosynthetic protein FliQ
MTLTFVPKLAGALAVLWVTMGFMTQAIVTFFTGTIIPLIQGAV